MKRKSWRSRSRQLAEIFENLLKKSLLIIYSTLMLTFIWCRLDGQQRGKSIIYESNPTDTLVSGNKVKLLYSVVILNNSPDRPRDTKTFLEHR